MNWEPPGFAHGRAAGCGSQSEPRLRGFHRPWLRDPTRDPARVGGGAHQEGGKIASPFLSFRPTVSFPAVASRRPNAQTTRTTPSVGRWREAHFSSFRFPSSSLWFSCQNTHSAPLLSLSPNTQRRDWTERERDRFLGDRRHHWQSADQKRGREEERGPSERRRRRRH